MLRVRKGPRGSVILELEPEEAMILRTLPARIRKLLEAPDFGDRVVQRLFPPAYRDPAKDAEYRDLLSKDLIARKLEGAAALEKALEEASGQGSGSVVTLTPATFDLVLASINDVRLILGTKLDITEDTWKKDLDPEDPDAYELALLHYLSILEETLIAAVDLGNRGKA
jgi:hypothetical protein